MSISDQSDKERLRMAKKQEMTARNCDVARSNDGKLYLPERMSYDEAIVWLQRKKREENEVVSFSELVHCFPPDGAVALMKAMKEKFGWTSMVATPGFFGATPPTMLDVDIGPHQSIKVPWGRFEIPGIDGHVETGVGMKDGQTVFLVQGQVRQKHYHILTELATLTKKFVEKESIYRGKAFKVEYHVDGKGEFGKMNAPKFLDLSQVKREELTFSDDLDRAIEDYLFTPIQKPEECEEAGIPVKRGICLTGGYGVGKTLTAYVAAQMAVEVDRTFIYLRDVRHLADAIEFAKQYAPAVVFAEDVDRVVSGERTADIDEILNTLDGMDSKENKVMVILTTNHVDEVNKALLRPGRIDLAIEITPPDAKAAEKLVRIYSGDKLDSKEDISDVGRALAGHIPAIIAEACQRAKLSMVSRGETDHITGSDLLLAAGTLKDQIRLLEDAPQERSKVEILGEVLGEGIGRGLGTMADKGLLSKDDLRAPGEGNGAAKDATPTL